MYPGEDIDDGESEVDWLVKRFSHRDMLEDTWVYQDWMRKGMAEICRQTILAVVQARFPELEMLTKEFLENATNDLILQRVLVEICLVTTIYDTIRVIIGLLEAREDSKDSGRSANENEDRPLSAREQIETLFAPYESMMEESSICQNIKWRGKFIALCQTLLYVVRYRFPDIKVLARKLLEDDIIDIDTLQQVIVEINLAKDTPEANLVLVKLLQTEDIQKS